MPGNHARVDGGLEPGRSGDEVAPQIGESGRFHLIDAEGRAVAGLVKVNAHVGFLGAGGNEQVIDERWMWDTCLGCKEFTYRFDDELTEIFGVDAAHSTGPFS
jgi:hypothetical protein